MHQAFRHIIAVACFSASLYTGAQTSSSTRTVALPSPQLIHCHAAECSRMWTEGLPDTGAVYPAQVLTDIVNGSIVGVTAVYDKSVSIEEIRTAIDARYAKWAMTNLNGTWRVEPEQLVIQLTDQPDGTKQLIYLQIGTFGSHVPSAHIRNGDNCS